jgi:hypothetical protein
MKAQPSRQRKIKIRKSGTKISGWLLMHKKHLSPLRGSGEKWQYLRAALASQNKGSTMNQQVQAGGRQVKMQQIIAKCWTDEAFKSQLIANPAATLQAEGVTFPAGATVKVMENSSQVVHVILPFRPTTLSDADLEQVAGGGATGQMVGGIVGGAFGAGAGPLGAIAGGVGATFLGGWLEDQGVFSGW